MFQKEAYNTIGIDLTAIQVLNGMIACFSNADIASRKTILDRAVYELSGRIINQQ